MMTEVRLFPKAIRAASWDWKGRRCAVSLYGALLHIPGGIETGSDLSQVGCEVAEALRGEDSSSFTRQ